MAGYVTALGTVTGLTIMQEFLKVNHSFQMIVWTLIIHK